MSFSMQRMGTLAPATGYEWFADGDNRARIQSARQHLQELYAPPGVKVMAATGYRFLEASFEEAHVDQGHAYRLCLPCTRGCGAVREGDGWGIRYTLGNW